MDLFLKNMNHEGTTQLCVAFVGVCMGGFAVCRRIHREVREGGRKRVAMLQGGLRYFTHCYDELQGCLS